MNPYITFAEYQELTLSENEVEESKFPKLLRAASDKLDYLTNNFYVFNSLSDDVPFRQNVFKKALVLMIDYYNFKGGTQSYQTAQASSVQIGRTMISNNASSNNNEISFDRLYGYPLEVYQLLISGGFLYKGVATTCL